mmetsp:Transcript_90148/g.160546  ORF Transcript_90148/g.160546 Transcript_90148/m.160546 type:complete len:270 (-) Transcript_90148:82-891(-)|eukprot:CAMPEP_0197634478 /NCGR_PEP_ID=MMETSP1338-20131121/10561_1 /TAXON_ID=43686 ORGANISM="Pelagodinium beii, Strain RCC1491" /NCGR_SAMPLE_ID=MMETSP1338 /ASSEMBLY_ACC=CAM_ASM_000754 /LENGTH=269 /DNA_ID=CAMNT_0043206349 /DNA_START=110 /DNA_END=916 /DNA_ORIENTATION=-
MAALLPARLAFAVAMLTMTTMAMEKERLALEDVPAGAERAKDLSLMQVGLKVETGTSVKAASGSRSMRSEKMFDETQHVAAELVKGAAKMAKEAAEETAEALSQAESEVTSKHARKFSNHDEAAKHPSLAANKTLAVEAKLQASSASEDEQLFLRAFQDFLLSKRFWLRLLVLCLAVGLAYGLCVGEKTVKAAAATKDLCRALHREPRKLTAKPSEKRSTSKTPLEAQKMGGDRRQLYVRDLHSETPDLHEPSAFHEDGNWRRAVAGGE